MAEYKSKYTLEDKQAALRDAIRRMEPVHQHWRMLESLYRIGAQREVTAIDLNRILPFPTPGTFLRTVNMVLPHLNLIINSVTARDPKLIVTPLGGDEAVIEKNATIAKAVLEYFWRRTAATDVLRDMTQDMVVIGNGFCKVGWSYAETTTDRTDEDIAAEVDELMATAIEVAQELGTPLDDAAIAEIVKSVSLTNQLVETDEPFVEYVSPYDIYVPANARRINATRWIAQKLRLPVADLKANKLFDKEAVEGIVPDTGYAERETIARYEDQEGSLPDIFTHATVYEFYDMEARTMCVLQIDGKKALYEGPIPYSHRYPPFVHMRNFNDGGQTFWSFGDVENVAGLQLMVNEIMIAEINDLKRVGNKYFINKKALTPELAKALQENKPDAVIPIEVPGNVAINEVLVPVQRLATPSDNYVMEGKLQDYMQRILGVTDLQAGAVQVASRVPATAAAAVEGASTLRSMDKQVNVERSSREIGVRVLALCQQFLDDGRAVRIAGPDAPTWLQVSAEDIDGEFSIETEGGSTQAVNPLTKARQGMEIMTQIAPMLAQMGYDPEPAIRSALSYMGLNPDHLLVRPQPQPQAAPMGPEQGGMLPGAEQGLPPELMGMPPMGEPPLDMNNPAIAQLMGLGGAPMPGVAEGDMLL
jgi:hypothetical protein